MIRAFRPLILTFFFFLMIRRPPRSTHCISSAASDVYKRQSNNSNDSSFKVRREDRKAKGVRQRFTLEERIRMVKEAIDTQNFYLVSGKYDIAYTSMRRYFKLLQNNPIIQKALEDQKKKNRKQQENQQIFKIRSIVYRERRQGRIKQR
eukprot:TRINITY_DN2979_c0_g1_i4.p2 TRINITY_DN2979_c0_g1~~TRINITY_DN2979_c0_g1_i4.p2  ORF type:complete len:149 (-),score=26.96 TRINITY_DN2979_c0_g1_i4:208-654(-)